MMEDQGQRKDKDRTKRHREQKESKDERRWNEGTMKEKEKKNRRMIRCDRTGKGDDGMKHHRKIEERKRNEGTMKKKEKKN